MLKRLLHLLFVTYVVILFLTGLIITFLLCLPVSISNSVAARKAIFFIISCWARVSLLLGGMPIKTTGKIPVGRHIIIANHISYFDTANIYAARLDYFRALGKMELSKIPVFGFLYKQVAITVDRSSPQSRAESIRLMRNFLEKEGNIFMFPEGTFNETGKPLKEFYDGAFRLAIETQTPLLPLIFPDTIDRWHYREWWTMWPGRNRGIYLEPVNVDGLTMEYLPELKQKVYTLMEQALIKHRTL